MTPRERIAAVLARQPVDRLPVDLWHTPEVGAALRAHTGAANDLDLYQRLGLDKIVWVFVDYPETDGGRRNAWGVPQRRIRAGAAEYDEVGAAPLAGFDTSASLDDYPYWPSAGRYDYAGAVARARAASQLFPVIGPWVSCFEIYCQMRSLEQAMIDLVEAPELVEAALDRIESIQTALLDRYLVEARGLVDLVFVSDDMAGQGSLLMSIPMWRQHLEPRLRRWCDLIHRRGARVFFHSDGAVEPLIGPLIACGIDVLNPIQHVCPGMEREHLKRHYGDRVIFHGGVDNQFALPRGTPDDVRRETQRCLETLGAGREGFICCSCHNVQAGTPVENVLAMIDTVRAQG